MKVYLDNTSGNRSRTRKLNSHQVVAIREKYALEVANGTPAKTVRELIAAFWKLNPDYVTQIVRGKTWPSAGGPIETGRRMA